MPVSVVDIDLTAETAAPSQETNTDVALIGTATEAPPSAEFGEVNQYGSAAEVAEDHGEDTDVHTASKAIQEMGAQRWRVVVLEQHEETGESVPDGEAVENTPIHGEAGVEAEGYDVVYTTEDPPEAPGEGEVAINTDTGTITTDDGTDATLDYAHVDWSALDALPDDINIVGFADVRMTRAHIGDLDELVTWASDEHAGVVAAHMNGNEAADDYEAMEVAHDIGAYVPSGDLLTVAHKSSADVASHVLGQLAINDAWFDPFYDGEGYPFSTDSYRKSLVGDPATEETFEGGDVAGDGPTNVLTTVNGTLVLSNSLTTAGADSDYQYFDIGRTEAFAAAEVENTLTSLRLRRDQIPFTNDGQSMIEGALKDAFSGLKGGPDDPFAEVDVHVPEFDELSDEDVANRVWSGIRIQGRLTGNVHEFSLELNVSV